MSKHTGIGPNGKNPVDKHQQAFADTVAAVDAMPEHVRGAWEVVALLRDTLIEHLAHNDPQSYRDMVLTLLEAETAVASVVLTATHRERAEVFKRNMNTGVLKFQPAGSIIRPAAVPWTRYDVPAHLTEAAVLGESPVVGFVRAKAKDREIILPGNLVVHIERRGGNSPEDEKARRYMDAFGGRAVRSLDGGDPYPNRRKAAKFGGVLMHYSGTTPPAPERPEFKLVEAGELKAGDLIKATPEMWKSMVPGLMFTPKFARVTLASKGQSIRIRTYPEYVTALNPAWMVYWVNDTTTPIPGDVAPAPLPVEVLRDMPVGSLVEFVEEREGDPWPGDRTRGEVVRHEYRDSTGTWDRTEMRDPETGNLFLLRASRMVRVICRKGT